MAGRPVVIVGTLMFTDDQPPIGGGNPPGIWGPPGPWPSPPIYFPPAWGGERPPGIWGGGNQPFPTPPIANVPGIGNPNPPGWGTGIWGGGNEPFPTPPIANVPGIGNPNPPGFGDKPGHPINLPPSPAPPGYDWRFVYLPFFGGWAWVLVPQGGEGAQTAVKDDTAVE